MADTIETILQKWGDENIAEAVQILTTANVSTSGALAESLKFEVRVDADKIIMSITEQDYGKFVRKGVQGALSSKLAPKSPFKYRDKMPPAGPIDRWVIQRGLSGTRDAKGRFVKRKTLTFLIRRSIFRFGLRPIDYLSPFFKNINDLQGLISENQRREILLLLQSTLNERIK